MYIPAMWGLIGAVIIVQSHMILGKLVGDHVCQSEESYPANVTEYRLRNATFRNYKWCMNVPPRCSYYTVKTINESRIVEKILTRTVEKCCEGYTEENGKCVPKCKEECQNGKCTDGMCTCSSGFKGASCDVGCYLGTWGPNCSNNCSCEGNTCDPVNGTCLEKPQTTLTSSPKPSTPSYISINEVVSKTTTDVISTSTREISLMTDKSTTDINDTANTTKRSHASFTVATANVHTLKVDSSTEAPSSISTTTTRQNITQSTTSVTNSNETTTRKSIHHVTESTMSSYQPEQHTRKSSSSVAASATTSPFSSTLKQTYTRKSSSSIAASATTSPFSSTLAHTTSLKPTQSNSFGGSLTELHPSTRVTVPIPKEVLIVSPKLNAFGVSSTEVYAKDKVVVLTTGQESLQTQQGFIDTTVTKTTPLSPSSSTTEIYLNESMALKEPVTTSMLATKSTPTWVNNTSHSGFTRSSNSNEVTENQPNTTPLTTSTPIAHSMPTKPSDHLDKPPAVINSTEIASNETKVSNLDDILKEYTIPVEVKYEIPAHKKEAASTHENYAEEKNYLTLEDRGYINKHVSSDSEYFVNSFTAAAVVVLVVAVLVMLVLGWNSWRGKKALEGRDAGRKDAAGYTTSIFHTPLPDPPIIENPTYLLTTIDCKKCNGETLLLKAHPAYPIHRMSQMGEVREYMYDHPPSTGSYRAASAVDPSDVSCSYTATEISEPVYDEIPLKNGVPSNAMGTNVESNMCLYVNTVGRTKF